MRFLKALRCFLIVIAIGFGAFFAACNSDEKDTDTQASFQNDAQSSAQDSVQGARSEASLSASAIKNVNLKIKDNEDLFIRINDSKFEFDNEQKATLFVFFTTWCVPCNALVPHLNNLQSKYKDSFRIIAVPLEKSSETTLNDFISKYGVKYDIAIGESNFDLATAAGGVSVLPNILLYGSNGAFINQYLGLIPEEMLDIDIQKAIN